MSRRFHETLAFQRNAGVGEEAFDFRVNDRVMTVDGFPGQVVACNAGPLPGTEDYQVTLDHGMGGGSYTASQLKKINPTTAALHEAAEFTASIPVEAITTHTADVDYPELGTILHDRLPNENIKLAANKDDESNKPQSSQEDPGERMDQQDSEENDEDDDENNTDTKAAEEPADEAGKDEGDAGPPDLEEEKEKNAPDVTPPSACSFCGADAFEDPQMTGRGVRMRCSQCGGTMKSWGGQWEPEFPNSPQNQASGQSDWSQGGAAGVANAPGANFKTSSLQTEAGIINWVVDKIYDRIEERKNHEILGNEWAWGTGIEGMPSNHTNYADYCTPSCHGVHPQSLHPEGLTIHGSLSEDYDSEWKFHFTSAWKDVQAKAKRIRKEGGVKIIVASNMGVAGEVKGDHNVYETQLNYVLGTKHVADWSCGCKWASYSWGRSPAFKRFEARLCSHALALQYEANARGMFGREIKPDTDRPTWQKAHQPVQVQYERPSDRHPEGRDLRRRAVPPGNMKRTFSSMENYGHPHMDQDQWNKNSDYRMGYQHGAQGEQKWADEAQARADVQRHDKNDIDYLVGHAHGTQHGRDTAEHKHEINKMWESAPEYGSVEHQINIMGREFGHEGSLFHRNDEHYDAGRQDGREYAQTLESPALAITGEALDRLGDYAQSHPEESGRYIKGFRNGHDDHFGLAPATRMPWFRAAALDSDDIYESPELLDLGHAPIFASIQTMAEAGEPTENIIEMVASHDVTREAAKAMLFEAFTDADGKIRDGDEYETPDGDRFNHGTPDKSQWGDPEFVRANPRDLTDHDDDKHADDHRRMHHRTNDAREHAPHWGWGFPAGVPIETCGQCAGSGCGHCAGQGQIAVNNSNPGQTDDAGDIVSGLSVAGAQHTAGDLTHRYLNVGNPDDPNGMRAWRKPGVPDTFREHLKQDHGYTDDKLKSLMDQHWQNARSGDVHVPSGQDNLHGVVDFMEQPFRNEHDHLHGGNPNKFEADGHKHPHLPNLVDHKPPSWQHGTAADPIRGGGPDPLNPNIGDFRRLRGTRPDLPNLGRNQDPNDQSNWTNLSRCQQTYDIHDDDRGHVMDAANEASKAWEHNKINRDQFENLGFTCHECGAFKHLHANPYKFDTDRLVNSAPYRDKLPRSMNSVHTADYSSADPLAGVDQQTYYSPTNHSNSRNPASTGWATSQDPGDWGRSLITNNFGLTTDSALDSEPTVAGVLLRASDTGRLLMIQRALSEGDKAAGLWEMPGGHLEDGEPPLHGAVREFEEETGHPFPQDAFVVHTWRSGPYRGHLVEVPSEQHLDFSQGRQIPNPDGDIHEHVAWWDPNHAKKNPALRPEMKGAPWEQFKKAADRKIDLDAGDGGSMFEHRFAEPDQMGTHCQGCARPLHPHEMPDGHCEDCLTAREAPDYSGGHAQHVDRETGQKFNDSRFNGDWNPTGYELHRLHTNSTLVNDPDEVGALPFTTGEADGDVFAGQTGGSSGDSSLPQASHDALSGGTGAHTTDSLHQAFLDTPGARAMMADLGITKAAMKDFSFQEQQDLINEGQGARARNFNDLKIAGTHYEHLGDDEDGDLFI